MRIGHPRTLLGLCAGALLCAAAPAGASAATIDVTNGTLNYRAESGRVNLVSFVQDAGTATVHVHRDVNNGDDDPIEPDTGCTADSAATGAADATAGASTTLTVAPTDGSFDVGQQIAGAGIPDGTTILSIASAPGGKLALTVSRAVNVAGGTVVTALDDADFTCLLVTDVLAVAADKDDILSAAGLTSIPARLQGGDGDDLLIAAGTSHSAGDGENGNDVIYGDGDGGRGDDQLFGGSSSNTDVGGPGDDRIFTEDGNDAVDGGDGNDYIDAGGGDDTVNGSAGADDIFSGTGNDTVDGGDGNDAIHADDGNDVADGGAGADDLFGGQGSDFLRGADGNDTLSGDTGDDRLFGGDGDDQLFGGDNNDFLNGGMGADTLAGGSGTNTADYSDAVGGVTVDLGAGDASGAAANGETLTGIQIVNGSAFDDTLTGDATDNVLNGGAGEDTIDGGRGNDTENGDDGNDTFTEGDERNGADAMSGGAGIDTADYSARGNAVTVTRDGVADDGEAGEGDNVEPDVEQVAFKAHPVLPIPPVAVPHDFTAPSLTGVSVNTHRISPNNDGVKDAFTATARFGEPTAWTFEVLSGSNAIYTQNGDGTLMRASWNGVTGTGFKAADGTYTWRITAKDVAGNAVVRTGKITVDRSRPHVRSVRVSHGVRQTRVGFIVSKAATVSARIVRARTVHRFAEVKLHESDHVVLIWNRKDGHGRLVPAGTYRLSITVLDEAGNQTVRRLTIRVTG